jgi:hypothetical protein
VKEGYTQFKASGFRSPDNWMGLFYSMTLLCFTAMLLYLDHHLLLDFNFHFSLNLLSLSLTSLIYRFFQFSLSINHFLFSLVFALLLALMIFPYFKYLFRATLNYFASKHSPFKVEGVETMSPFYKFSFVMPVVISTLWVRKISDFARGTIGDVAWEHFRIGFVVFYCFLRFYQLRTEVQVLLDQGKLLIFEIIRSKNTEERKEMESQCKAIGSYAWPVAHQSISCTCLILSLCFLLLCKGELWRPYPQPLVVTTSRPMQDLDENEFILDNTAVVTPSMSVAYFKEIKELEDFIKAQKNVRESLQKTVENLAKAQVIPCFFYRDMFEFMIWIYHLASVFAVGLTLLYKRRFYKEAQKALQGK